MNEWYEDSTEVREPHKRTEATVRKSRPKKGRYLKQPAPSSHRRRRRRRKLNPRFVVLVAVLLAMLIGITVGVRSCTKPTIKGRWNLDGTTIYEFGKNGKGALVLMHTEYEFNYTVEGDLLVIDFVDEGALDAKYTFAMNKKMLFLTGGPGDSQSEYILYRVY